MTEQPRDWDRELAHIDKAIAKQQPAASGPVQTGSTPPPMHRRFVALTWFWTGLAVLLAVALPYELVAKAELHRELVLHARRGAGVGPASDRMARAGARRGRRRRGRG